MSSYFSTSDRSAFVDSLNLGAGAETVVYAPGVPIDVKRVILVMTTAQATAGAVLTIGVRDVDDGNSVTVGTATTPAVMALDAVFYIDIAASDPDPVVTSGEVSQVQTIPLGVVNGIQTSLPGVVKVLPGQELFIASGGEGDTGVANVYIQYFENGFDVNAATNIVFTVA